MIASLFSANGVAAPLIHVRDMISKRVVTPAGKAFRHYAGLEHRRWAMAGFFGLTNNASGGAVFLQQGAEFSLRQKMKLE